MDNVAYAEIHPRHGDLSLDSRFAQTPNVGKSNQFIGLMVRFDVLRELGQRQGTLVKEMKDPHLPELRDGIRN